jgi:3-mercaptopyruvate sulfurtransferase SseA
MIDCRTGLSVVEIESYERQSSGARFLALDRWRNLTATPVSYQMPRPDEFKARLLEIGVTIGDHVVMFDDSDGTSAC